MNRIILSILLLFIILNCISTINASDETQHENGDVDCYSSCVEENKDVCKTEWQQCVSLMERCRNNCDKTSKRIISKSGADFRNQDCYNECVERRNCIPNKIHQGPQCLAALHECSLTCNN